MTHFSGWFSYIRYDEKRDQPTINLVLLRRVWHYARPYHLKTIGLLVTIIIITALSMIPPLLYRDLIDYTLPNKNTTRLNWLAVGMIAIPIINALVGMVQRYLSSTIGESLIADLRSSLFNHLQQKSLRFFTHAKTGELMSRLNNDVVGAQNALTGTFVTIASNIIMIISILTIMLSLEWQLTLLSVILVPIFVIPTKRVGRILRDVRRESMDLNAKINTLMQETLNINGVLLVKIFGRQTNEMEKFQKQSRDVADIGIRGALVWRWFFLFLGLISAVGTALVFWVGGHLVLQGNFTVGTIVAFGAYLTQLYGPLTSISNAHLEFATSMVSFERVFEILDLPIEIQDKPGAVSLRNVSGAVTFQDVSFSYTEGGDGGASRLGLSAKRNGSKKEVEENETSLINAGDIPEENPSQFARKMALDKISFEVKQGQLAALVGPSGAGKTTITYLLPRLYDPTIGRICLDGYDLRDVTLKSLADSIGMVTQETHLFHDTLKANLLYAKPDASQEKMEAACRVANIHHFINSLPDKYDTVVGERGYRLSGGEKQRMAIARVILKDPRILILDEATSSLDSHSEALIQEALERIMRNRTSIVIAHRLSTILAADIILVMSNGRLVEQAERNKTSSAHDQLLAQSGLYAELYRTQFRIVE